jgi:hypothetical protein
MHSKLGTTSLVHNYAFASGSKPHCRGTLNNTSHSRSQLVTAHFVVVTCDDEKSDLQILQILQNIHLAKPDHTAALCHRGPNSWAFVCKTGLEFIDKSSIWSDMMWFDFIHKFSNQSKKKYVIQPNLTLFDPVIRVFGWGSALMCILPAVSCLCCPGLNSPHLGTFHWLNWSNPLT